MLADMSDRRSIAKFGGTRELSFVSTWLLPDERSLG
jgi:hypothetical protein